MRLFTINTPGNAHEAAIYLNKLGLAEYLVQIDVINGYHSVTVLKVPLERVAEVAKKLGEKIE